MKAARFGNEDPIHRAFERTPLDAMVQSGTVLSETAKHLFEEWADIGRARIERGFGRIEAFLQCRTPQDFAALQGELLRDNMETVVSYARKAREHSTRLADEAERRFGSPRRGHDISTGRGMGTRPDDATQTFASGGAQEIST